MTFRKRLQYFLVKRLNISNKNALKLILQGNVLVNEIVIFENIEIDIEDTIVCEHQILQTGKQVFKIAFYKPRGIETTLNTDIQDNLKDILPFEERLFPVGRLDKESEGLLLLTTDGKVSEKITSNIKNKL